MKLRIPLLLIKYFIKDSGFIKALKIFKKGLLDPNTISIFSPSEPIFNSPPTFDFYTFKHLVRTIKQVFRSCRQSRLPTKKRTRTRTSGKRGAIWWWIFCVSCLLCFLLCWDCTCSTLNRTCSPRPSLSSTVPSVINSAGTFTRDKSWSLDWCNTKLQYEQYNTVQYKYSTVQY